VVRFHLPPASRTHLLAEFPLIQQRVDGPCEFSGCIKVFDQDSATGVEHFRDRPNLGSYYTAPAGQRFENHQGDTFTARRKNHDVAGGQQRCEIVDLSTEIEDSIQPELVDAPLETFFLRAIAGDDESKIALGPQLRELARDVGQQQWLLAAFEPGGEEDLLHRAGRIDR